MKRINRNQAVPVLIVIACVVHILIFKGKVNLNLPVSFRILYAFLTLVVVLPVHELLHFLCMKLLELKDVKIECARDPMGFPSLRTIGKGELPRWKKNITLMAPLLVLTIIPDAVMLITGNVPFLFFCMVMENAAGCCFDIADVLRIK